MSSSVVISISRLRARLFVGAVMMVVFYVLSKALGPCDTYLCTVSREFVHLDGEANLPAWFSTVLWLMAGISAVAVGLTEKARGHARAVYWTLFGGICLFLSLDEGAMFHERFGGAFGRMFSARDFLVYHWLMYGIVAVVVVGVLFIPFLRHLPSSTRWRLCLAAGLFVLGAVGVESIGGARLDGSVTLFDDRVFWGVQIIVEEFLEMLAVILLIDAILRYWSQGRDDLRFALSGPERGV